MPPDICSSHHADGYRAFLPLPADTRSLPDGQCSHPHLRPRIPYRRALPPPPPDSRRKRHGHGYRGFPLSVHCTRTPGHADGYRADLPPPPRSRTPRYAPGDARTALLCMPVFPPRKQRSPRTGRPCTGTGSAKAISSPAFCFSISLSPPPNALLVLGTVPDRTPPPLGWQKAVFSP